MCEWNKNGNTTVKSIIFVFPFLWNPISLNAWLYRVREWIINNINTRYIMIECLIHKLVPECIKLRIVQLFSVGSCYIINCKFNPENQQYLKESTCKTNKTVIVLNSPSKFWLHSSILHILLSLYLHNEISH